MEAVATRGAAPGRFYFSAAVDAPGREAQASALFFEALYAWLQTRDGGDLGRLARAGSGAGGRGEEISAEGVPGEMVAV